MRGVRDSVIGKSVIGTTKIVEKSVIGTTKTVQKMSGQAVGATTDLLQNTTDLLQNTTDLLQNTTTDLLQNTTGLLQRGQEKKNPESNSKNSRRAWETRVTAENTAVELVLECRRLPKRHSFQPTDAFCCVWEAPAGYTGSSRPQKDSGGGSGGPRVSRLPGHLEREVGRTEVVRDDRDPVFTTTFRLNYRFGLEQCYVVRVYHEDLRYNTELKEHDYLGGCVFTLSQIMGAAGCAIAKPLRSHCPAFIILQGQEIQEARDVLELRCAGQDLGLLDKKNSNKVTKELLELQQKVNVAKNVLDKFDAYFRLEKLNKEDQSWTVVWRSEVAKDSQSPVWNTAKLPLQMLCDDDPDTELKITIWLWNRFVAHDMVGFLETTVSEVVQKSRRGIPVFDIVTERKKMFGVGTKLKKTGQLKILKAKVLSIPSMLQYTAGGCQLNCMVAVDYTALNGINWRHENCLHHRCPNGTWWNDYQAVLFKVGSIFSAYEGRDFVAWGYGGNNKGMTKRYFNLGAPGDQQPQQKRLRTANDLLQAYNDTLGEDNDSFHLGMKAELKHILEAAVYRSVKASQNQQCYSVLVIVTTGAIDDLPECVDCLCDAAQDAPLSIAIVAIGRNAVVGQDDFAAVRHLTGSEIPGSGGQRTRLRSSNGVPVARDMVHFAGLHEHNGDAAAATAASLSQVPEQFVQYFLQSGTKPLPPRAVPDFSGRDVFSSSSHHSTSGRKRQQQQDDGQSARSGNGRRGRSRNGGKRPSASPSKSRSRSPGSISSARSKGTKSRSTSTTPRTRSARNAGGGSRGGPTKKRSASQPPKPLEPQ